MTIANICLKNNYSETQADILRDVKNAAKTYRARLEDMESQVARAIESFDSGFAPVEEPIGIRDAAKIALASAKLSQLVNEALRAGISAASIDEVA